MYLTSITQRDRFFELAMRWLADRPQPGDGTFATQVFIYENVIAAPSLRGFFMDIVRATHGGPVCLARLSSKDELRRAIIEAMPEPGARAAELFDLYARFPDEFFPRTPTDLVLASAAGNGLLGMFRVKRVRRIADKASRRVADRLSGQIKIQAAELAARRAALIGVPLEQFVSTPEEMLEDFAGAERIVSHAFKDGRIVFEPLDLRVDDVLGLKFIGRPEDLARIEQSVKAHPAVRHVEREEHRGRYNDVNLVVDLELPAPERVIDAARGQDWTFAAGRGLTPGQLAAGFPGYVESGARTIRTEVILCTPDELVESEFGRSIHEARIIEQRTAASYSGRIASNAGFLIEYLLMLAVSPVTEIDELPVKMWGRYLHDVYALSVWNLFKVRLGLDLVDAFTE